MKKILIATVAALVLLISDSEAQTSPTPEVTVKNLAPPPPPPPRSPDATVPPPPPPPPPVNQVPATAPVPPVPQLPPPPPPPAESEDYAENNIDYQDRAKVVIPDNEKGFVLTVRQENNKSVVVVRKEGYNIRKIALATWLAENKKYEDIYGKLPPPPPPRLHKNKS